MKGNPYDAGLKRVSRQGVPLFYPTLGKGYPCLFRNIVQQLRIQRSLLAPLRSCHLFTEVQDQKSDNNGTFPHP